MVESCAPSLAEIGGKGAKGACGSLIMQGQQSVCLHVCSHQETNID